MAFGKEEVCAYLDSRGVVYDRVDHEAVFTMEAMDALSLPFANVVVKRRPVPMEMVGIQNRFGQVGSRDFLMKEYQHTYLSTRLRESIHWSFIRNWENLDFLQWMYRKSTAAWA